MGVFGGSDTPVRVVCSEAGFVERGKRPKHHSAFGAQVKTLRFCFFLATSRFGVRM